MKKYIITGVIIVLLLLLFVSGRSTYNSMVTLDQDVEQAWGKVQVQYQRRLDLIPNMVETVKGYAAHESNTYENVTKARAGLSDAYNEANGLKNATPDDTQSFEKYNQAQQELNRALSIYVNAVHEAYPDLKANEQYLALTDELAGTENRIAVARKDYNDAAKEYNVSVKRFPKNIIAAIFDFDDADYFEAADGADTVPEVSFD